MDNLIKMMYARLDIYQNRLDHLEIDMYNLERMEIYEIEVSQKHDQIMKLTAKMEELDACMTLLSNHNKFNKGE